MLPFSPFRCDCGREVLADQLQKHMNECTQMHSKYGALVRSYVTLKLESSQDVQN